MADARINNPFVQAAAPPATPAQTAANAAIAAAPATPTASAPAQVRNPLGQNANWMQGLNPTGWQSLGGDPNTNYLNMSNWSQGGVDPTKVQTNGDPLSMAQPFIDSSYQQATRELDPQWQQNQAALNQQLINEGIAPGSAAYNQAQTQLSQQKNDAYGSAQNAAQQQGLAAQAQSFGQGLSQSQLANSLTNALIGANSQYGTSQLAGNASITGSQLGNQASILQSMLSGNATRDAAGASASASRYGSLLNNQLGNANLAENSSQNNFNNLFNLLGMGNSMTGFNNNAQNQQQQQNQSLLSLIPGQSGGNIDVQSPYNNQYNGQQQQYMNGQNNANAQNQEYAQWASSIASLFCSREYKETQGPMDTLKCLGAVMGLPVDRWNYKGQAENHIGTYAEEFNKAVDLPDAKTIQVIDMLGTLLGAVQEIGKKVARLEEAHG